TPDVKCMEVQPDGRILIAGSFTTVDGRTRRAIARLEGGLLAGAPPLITTVPVSQTVREGQSAQFSVLVVSSGKPALQWQFNGKDLQDTTNNVLAILSARMTNVGEY